MGSAPDESLQKVARAMLTDLEPIMDSIADNVWSTVRGYATTLLEREDLRARVRDSITIVIACLLDERPPSVGELERSARNGERRALQGIGHAALVQSYRQAERLLGDVFQSLCVRMQVRPASARLGRARMIEYLDALEEAMVSAYLRMQQQIMANNAIAEPTLMRKLAGGGSIEPSEVEQLADVLGLDLVDDAPFVGIAVTIVGDHDETDLLSVRHHVVFQLRSALGVTVLSGTTGDSGSDLAVFAVPWGGSLEVVAQSLTEAIGEKVLRPSCRAAIGDVRFGLVHVGASCRHAIMTLEATEGTDTERRGLLYRDRLLEVSARRDPTIARSLHERYIGPLAAHDFLVETLRCHLETNLSLGQTAERLHVHKNTVGYRLKRIQDLTGIDLRSVRDIARAVLALEGSVHARSS